MHSWVLFLWCVIRSLYNPKQASKLIECMARKPWILFLCCALWSLYDLQQIKQNLLNVWRGGIEFSFCVVRYNVCTIYNKRVSDLSNVWWGGPLRNWCLSRQSTFGIRMWVAMLINSFITILVSLGHKHICFTSDDPQLFIVKTFANPKPTCKQL